MSTPTFNATASAFRSGQATLDQLLLAFRATTVYARRPPHPGLFLVDLGERGQWTFVFTTLDALAQHAAQETPDDIDYFSTVGADLLDNLLPSGVGLFVDAHDQHALALPPDWLTDVQSNGDNPEAFGQ